ncbi:MAG: hypothetical protein WAT66_11290 [Actinomycetota bacterium]
MAGGKVARGVNALYLNFVRIFRGRGLEEMAGALITGMRETVMATQNQFIRVRAAAVRFNGGAVLLPSPPQPHLSGLAAALASKGGAYLGDEIVKIDPIEHLAHGVDLPLVVDSSDLSLFPELKRTPAKRSSRERHRDAITPRQPVTIDELGARFGEPAPVQWIIFPTFEPGAETSIESIAASTALFRFTVAGLNLHIWGDRALILMRQLLEEANIAEMTVGSIPQAADLIARTVLA